MIFRRMQLGFTLLEMVLVLLIMGMVASLSVVFIDNEDSQLRYEESVNKLETMHKATVADYKNGALYSGVVVDNGTLPTKAKDFVSIPENWIQYGETYIDTTDPLNPEVKSRVLPYLRLTKKDLVTTLDNSDYIIFSSGNKRFYSHKGYRAGYISLGIDSDRDYKDGWGRAFTVGLDTDGSAPDPETNTASFQDFELAINDPEIDPDMQINRNVTKDNWSVALTDIVIKVQNDSTSAPVENIIIGLSVFTNKAFTRPAPATGDDSEICKDCWTTYHIRRKCISNQKQPVPTIGASESVSISDDEGYI
ncbi:MAG: prepilin-type N-terminal cleavage/methylation domain-containing protein, partial [Methylomarinum sp.]|nr:prepilin-type N-terminal cleavage/methylation domain-containing protein [Methylomarinum sp.]